MKKLIREWTESHKMKNIYDEVEDVVVTCREYEYHYIGVERYAVGESFGQPVFGNEYCDSDVKKEDTDVCKNETDV